MFVGGFQPRKVEGINWVKLHWRGKLRVVSSEQAGEKKRELRGEVMTKGWVERGVA